MGKTRISEVRVDDRPERLYLGIRTQTPFKGMFKVVASLAREMDGWLERQGVTAAGPHFLRCHAVDMTGEMDISYGIPVREAISGDGGVTVDSLPGGRYASLVYVGHGLAGNKALLAWATRNSVAWDWWRLPRVTPFGHATRRT